MMNQDEERLVILYVEIGGKLDGSPVRQTGRERQKQPKYHGSSPGNRRVRPSLLVSGRMSVFSSESGFFSSSIYIYTKSSP